MKKYPVRKRAFTLVELLITIGIIIIIAGVAVPQVAGYINRSKSARAKMDLSTISTAIKCFYTDWGRYPSSLNDLLGIDTTDDAVNTSESYTIAGLPGGIDYLGVRIPVDIFNQATSENEYKYHLFVDHQNYIIWSIGPNKAAEISDTSATLADDTITIVYSDEFDDVYDSNCIVSIELDE
ncbi:MAG: type II secretion system protein GspG [Caldisericia bacterium]|nr:type II secretion system protein GspG [Caldisericia bacterium]